VAGVEPHLLQRVPVDDNAWSLRTISTTLWIREPWRRDFETGNVSYTGLRQVRMTVTKETGVYERQRCARALYQLNQLRYRTRRKPGIRSRTVLW
jgi:hypothetical protein